MDHVFSDESLSMKPMLPASILEAWSSLAPDVRAALVESEKSRKSDFVPTMSSTSSMTSRSSDESLEKRTDNNGEDGEHIFVEIDAEA